MSKRKKAAALTKATLASSDRGSKRTISPAPAGPVRPFRGQGQGASSEGSGHSRKRRREPVVPGCIRPFSGARVWSAGVSCPFPVPQPQRSGWHAGHSRPTLMTPMQPRAHDSMLRYVAGARAAFYVMQSWLPPLIPPLTTISLFRLEFCSPSSQSLGEGVLLPPLGQAGAVGRGADGSYLHPECLACLFVRRSVFSRPRSQMCCWLPFRVLLACPIWSWWERCSRKLHACPRIGRAMRT